VVSAVRGRQGSGKVERLSSRGQPEGSVTSAPRGNLARGRAGAASSGAARAAVRRVPLPLRRLHRLSRDGRAGLGGAFAALVGVLERFFR